MMTRKKTMMRTTMRVRTMKMTSTMGSRAARRTQRRAEGRNQLFRAAACAMTTTMEKTTPLEPLPMMTTTTTRL